MKSDRDVMERLVGREFDFYGVNNESFALDGEVYTAVEDHDDGYRSYMETVVCEHCLMTMVFPRHCLARVRVLDLSNTDEEGYRLVDVDTGHAWLEFGTCHADNYYPYFFFTYTPALGDTEAA
jgi:hypothetical protein